MDLLLAVEVAKAEGEQGQYLGALHRVLDHLAEGSDHLGIADRLLQVILVAEDEVDREHPRLGRDGCGVGGGRKDEIDVAGADLLEHLRLLPQLPAGKLVDDQRPVAQLLELVGEGVCRKAVGGGMRLIVAEGEVTLGGAGALSCQRQARERRRSGDPHPFLGWHRFLPWSIALRPDGRHPVDFTAKVYGPRALLASSLGDIRIARAPPFTPRERGREGVGVS